MGLLALAVLLMLLATPVIAQERACPDERDQLRVLTTHLVAQRSGLEGALADAQVREQRLLRRIEELTAAKKEEPKK